MGWDRPPSLSEACTDKTTDERLLCHFKNSLLKIKKFKETFAALNSAFALLFTIHNFHNMLGQSCCNFQNHQDIKKISINTNSQKSFEFLIMNELVMNKYYVSEDTAERVISNTT